MERKRLTIKCFDCDGIQYQTWTVEKIKEHDIQPDYNMTDAACAHCGNNVDLTVTQIDDE